MVIFLIFQINDEGELGVNSIPSFLLFCKTKQNILLFIQKT